MKRSLCLVLLVALLGGCDLLGDDYDHLAPGTFRLRADGKTYTGTARFYPMIRYADEDPLVYLLSTDNIPFSVRSRDLLAATEGSRIEGEVSFRPGASHFVNESGSITITGISDSGLSGTFRYDMYNISLASASTSITVRGGFNAVRVPD